MIEEKDSNKLNILKLVTAPVNEDVRDGTGVGECCGDEAILSITSELEASECKDCCEDEDESDSSLDNEHSNTELDPGDSSCFQFDSSQLSSDEGNLKVYLLFVNSLTDSKILYFS